MENLLHQIAAGVVSGSLYGGLALALVMVHRATGHINFAQGEMATFAAFIAFALLQAGFPFLIAAAVACVVSFALGVLIEVALMKRLSGSSPLRSVIVTIGLFMFFNGISGFLFGYSTKPMESPFAGIAVSNQFLSPHELGTLAVLLILVASLFAVFRFTEFGLAMKAAALNPVSARLVGVRVDLIKAIGWGMAGFIGAVVSLMVAPVVFLEPNMMLGVLVYGFAASLVGGIDNPWGAMVGGILVGVTENMAGTYLVGTDLKLTVALSIIIVVLLVRPAGLFGRIVVRRV